MLEPVQIQLRPAQIVIPLTSCPFEVLLTGFDTNPCYAYTTAAKGKSDWSGRQIDYNYVPLVSLLHRSKILQYGWRFLNRAVWFLFSRQIDTAYFLKNLRLARIKSFRFLADNLYRAIENLKIVMVYEYGFHLGITRASCIW